MTSARSEELRRIAQLLVDALPVGLVQEVVLTGSVSRGTADDASDIEMLIVTGDPLQLEDCLRLAAEAGMESLGTWGSREGPERLVSGLCQGTPVELIWWPSGYAEECVDALLAGERESTADALVHGVPLRTGGRLSHWQERLSVYPPELAARQIEAAALRWGGFAAAALLTLLRPGDRLALAEWTVDSSSRLLTILFAVNGVWRPTTKRLASRVALLPIKPDRLAERIEEALTTPDARRALLVMTELQLETVVLAPSGPYIDRARGWLAEGVDLISGNGS